MNKLLGASVEISTNWIGTRRMVLIGIALIGLWSAYQLRLTPHDLVPGVGGLQQLGRFFAAGCSPALTYEAEFIPQGTEPLLVKVMRAMGATVVFASAAASLSLAVGLVLGFFASSAWWREDSMSTFTPLSKVLRRVICPALCGISRVLIALMRSIHELLWAVLFLAAMGLTHLAAVIAIAIPYSGILAKIFAEMIDEAPRDTAVAMRSMGAKSPQVFLFGLMPRVIPDLTAYALYRFECALRSSAVLGFFGIPTLGYYLKLSFQNSHYHEIWTYLYAVILLVVVVDVWSGALRKRIVS